MATFGTFANGVSLKAVELNDFLVWTSFTPVLRQSATVATVASGRVGRYASVNKLIYVNYNMQANGAGTASNRFEVDLPLTAVSSSGRVAGFGVFFDASSSTIYQIIPVLVSTTRFAFITSSATSLTSYLGTTNGPAITLAVSDQLQFSVVYEAA
jgi:hypothetical protein